MPQHRKNKAPRDVGRREETAWFRANKKHRRGPRENGERKPSPEPLSLLIRLTWRSLQGEHDTTALD